MTGHSRPLILGASLAIFFLFAALGCRSQSRPETPQAEETKPECRVSVSWDEGVFVELLITDPDRIREAVEEPLRAAKRDPEPARYIIFGSLSLRRKDGTTQTITLFHPWGLFKDGGTYKIADFSKLQKLYRTTIKGLSTAEFLE